jgi:hypothetical protein
LSSDIINIILNYELTLKNLNKKLNLKKIHYNNFTIEKIMDLLLKSLRYGYIGYSIAFLSSDRTLEWFNYINKIIKFSDINDKISILSETNNIIIYLKDNIATTSTIHNAYAFIMM